MAIVYNLNDYTMKLVAARQRSRRREAKTMTIYSTVLFIHVVSAIGLFIALAAEGAIFFRIRSTQSVEEARFFIRVFQRLRIVAIPSFLGVLVGGMYLASKWGRGILWIPLALGATLLIMLIGGFVTGIRRSEERRVGK